jgi:hypothetical protein
MRQLLVCAAFATLVATAACGSDSNNNSTGTVATFTGTWQGTFDGVVQVTANASQTGDSTSGTFTITYNGHSYPGTFGGTSNPPSLILNAAIGDSTGTYDASYATNDSVFGTFTLDTGNVGSPVEGDLALKKQ